MDGLSPEMQQAITQVAGFVGNIVWAIIIFVLGLRWSGLWHYSSASALLKTRG